MVNDLSVTNICMGTNGRLVIPADYRKAMGLKEGDSLVLALIDNELRINKLEDSIKFAQELVSKHAPSNGSVVDNFIQERRLEAEQET